MGYRQQFGTLACMAIGLFVVKDAMGAYSGFTTRSTCGTDLFVNTSDFWYFDPAFDGGCSAEWLGGSISGQGVYDQMVETRGAATIITTTLSVFGSSQSNLARVCATSTTYFSYGGIDMVSPPVCTMGASPVLQDIITAGIVLPGEGAATTVVTATGSAVVRKVSWTYTTQSWTTP